MQFIIVCGILFTCLGQILPNQDQDLLTLDYDEPLTNQKIQDPSANIRLFRATLRNENEKKIQEHNQQQSKTYEQETNQFAQLTENQINQFVLNLFPSSQNVVKYAKSLIPTNIAHSQQILPTQSDTYYNMRNEDMELSFEDIPPTPEQILGEIKFILAGRNISQARIQESLPEYTNLNVIQNTRVETPIFHRRLQQSQTEAGSFDIDWTCLSGTVRYQGRCGSCYAFAPVDGLSSMFSIYQYGFFVSFSPQQIVDCAKNNLAVGCLGGFLEGSYTYMTNFGIKTEYAYPYVNQKDSKRIQSCQNEQNDSGSSWKINDFTVIQEGDCDEVKRKLQLHPISVGIAARSLLYYRRGVVENCDKVINHAVLLVGYEENKGWKYKNSWGTRWGEKGYGWVSQKNNCQICEMARYPILDSFNPEYDSKIRSCPNP